VAGDSRADALQAELWELDEQGAAIAAAAGAGLPETPDAQASAPARRAGVARQDAKYGKVTIWAFRTQKYALCGHVTCNGYNTGILASPWK